MNRRTVVYVACPMRKGEWDENMRRCIDAAERLRRKGYTVILPSLTWLWALRYKVDFEEWIEMDYGLIAVSDCILRVPGESEGAVLELDFAARNDVTIFLTELDLFRDMKPEMPFEQTLEVHATGVELEPVLVLDEDSNPIKEWKSPNESEDE